MLNIRKIFSFLHLYVFETSKENDPETWYHIYHMKILENEDLNIERFINVNRDIEEKPTIYRNV